MVHQSNRKIQKNKNLKGGVNAESLAFLISCPAYNNTVSNWLRKNYESAEKAQERAEELQTQEGSEKIAAQEAKHAQEARNEATDCKNAIEKLSEKDRAAIKIKCDQLEKKVQFHSSKQKEAQTRAKGHSLIKLKTDIDTQKKTVIKAQKEVDNAQKEVDKAQKEKENPMDEKKKKN